MNFPHVFIDLSLILFGELFSGHLGSFFISVRIIRVSRGRLGIMIIIVISGIIFLTSLLCY